MQLQAVFTNKSVSGETQQLVDAQKLHTFICADSRFNDWITNRITKYGFIENQDYIKETIKTSGRPSTNYHIILDMAKELCMVENNEKGREARRYFIEVEKAYRNQPPQIDLPPYPLQRENIELKRAINRLTENEKLAKNVEFINFANHHDLLDALANMSWAINTIEELFLHLKRYDGNARSYVDRIIARFPHDEGIKKQAKAKTQRQMSFEHCQKHNKNNIGE